VREKIDDRSPQEDVAHFLRMEGADLRRKIVKKDPVQEKKRYPRDRIKEYSQYVIPLHAYSTMLYSCIR
jgi:hypothetical protein